MSPGLDQAVLPAEPTGKVGIQLQKSTMHFPTGYKFKAQGWLPFGPPNLVLTCPGQIQAPAPNTFSHHFVSMAKQTSPGQPAMY